MKKFLSLIILILLPYASAEATDFVSNRHCIDADWQFIRQDMANAWEVFRPVQAGKPESVPLWESVSLPHCFNAQDAVNPDVNYYQGFGWYRKYIQVDNPYRKGRTFLEFEGVGQETQVYVYTKLVGSHVGGYDRWKVDITDAVNAFLKSPDAKRFKGKVPVVVRCDNSRNVERIPSSMSDFNVYGGLYRHVHLLYQPVVAIDDIQLQADVKTKLLKAIFRMTSYDKEGAACLSVCLKDPTGKLIYQTKQALQAKQEMQDLSIPVAKPKIWDVEHPLLYTLEAKLMFGKEEQTYVTKAGFRSFEFKQHGPFYLNGRRLLLNGTHRHEDHAGVGAAMTDEMIRHEMLQIKNMGANFIRLGHYQQSDLVLQLCDSLGILVWEEIPWCRGGLGGEKYQRQAQQMLTHMIEQHYNHPSIILWGLGNENDWRGDFPTFSNDSIHAFMQKLNHLAHQLDASRKTTIRRCDFCSDITDVYSPTIWAGWYSGTMKDYRKMTEDAISKYPHFFHAEWGGDSHVGRHTESTNLENVNAGDRNGDWSETYMVHLFDWTLKEQQSMPQLTGSAFWTFKDFSTPLRPTNPIPYVNQKGVIERDGTPKESYYVFQSYWSKKPMIHIYGHSVPTRWGRTDEKKEVLVYSNCRKVELFVNGVSQGVRYRNVKDYPAAGFHWDVNLQSGQNEILAIGDKGLKDSICQEYQTEAWGNPHHICLKALSKENGVVTLEAQVEDENNLKCLDYADFIYFDAIGDAELIVNQGTSTGSRKIQASNGRARIKLRLPNDGKETHGKAVVSAKTSKIKDYQIFTEVW